MSGRVGGEAFRQAWQRVREVMNSDPEAAIVEELRLVRGDVGVQVQLKLALPPGWGDDTSVRAAVNPTLQGEPDVTRGAEGISLAVRTLPVS